MSAEDLEAQAHAALDKQENGDVKVDSGDKDVQPKADGDDGADAKVEDKPDAKGEKAPADKEPGGESDDEADDDLDKDNGLEVAELPERAQFIYGNLPSLAARGHLGDNKLKTFNVKTAQELPDKFEFATKRDELLFVQELADQAQRATKLDDQWQQKDQQTKFEEWQNQQAMDVAADLKELQKEGLIPKFTDKQANEELDNPGVKLANEAYEHMQKVNTARANAGKPYFLSFRDAFEQIQAKKGAIVKPEARTDQERQRVASKIGAGKGTSRELKKPERFKSVWDIIDMHDELDG